MSKAQFRGWYSDMQHQEAITCPRGLKNWDWRRFPMGPCSCNSTTPRRAHSSIRCAAVVTRNSWNWIYGTVSSNLYGMAFPIFVTLETEYCQTNNSRELPEHVQQCLSVHSCEFAVYPENTVPRFCQFLKVCASNVFSHSIALQCKCIVAAGVLDKFRLSRNGNMSVRNLTCTRGVKWFANVVHTEGML